jgi:hypothetical protein
MKRFGRAWLVFVPLAALASCDGQESIGTVPSGLSAGAPHIMPLFNGVKNKAAPNAHLTFRGGPVLQNVRVVTVFWGANQFAANLNSYYGAVTNSAYYDWLSEYNTTNPTQHIGRGTFVASYNDSGAPAGHLTDTQVKSRLGSLIDQGRVPAPDANTYYAIHFAPGISIDDSCSSFCAYHGSFSHNGRAVYYGVLPDLGGQCAGGCGSNANMIDNLTLVASHELVEATTDADVGNNNLAWYDDNNGEIGDICVGQQGSAAGYAVQKEWSNQAGACIDHGAGGGGGSSVHLVDVNSGKCIDVNGAATADGTKIQIWSCNGTGAQSFNVQQGGNSTTMVNTNSNKCVDVPGSSTTAGAKIQLWTCNGTGAQSFQLKAVSGGSYQVVNTHSGQCLDVSGAGTADGTQIVQWPCHTGNNQRFKLVSQ